MRRKPTLLNCHAKYSLTRITCRMHHTRTKHDMRLALHATHVVRSCKLQWPDHESYDMSHAPRITRNVVRRKPSVQYSTGMQKMSIHMTCHMHLTRTKLDMHRKLAALHRTCHHLTTKNNK